MDAELNKNEPVDRKKIYAKHDFRYKFALVYNLNLLFLQILF